MAIPKDIEPTTDDPLDLKGLKILIDEGIKIDMLLQYTVEQIPIAGARKNSKQKFVSEGSFQIFARYNHPYIIRQIYTQRNHPRKFKSLERALSWGQKVGFRSANMTLNFHDYIAFDAGPV